MKLTDFDFRVWSDIDNTYLHNPSLTITHFKSAVYKNAYSMEVGEVIDENKDEREVLIGCLDNNRYKSVEIELWSGFYDKNGKKIYEGDIVKYDSNTRPLVVVFEKNTFYIVDTSIEKHLQVDCGTRLQGIYENRINGYKENKIECLEVLGNIHENAELLKKESISTL
ncbi:hypothetical protein T36_2186 (plasmid) [Helicobacter cinaedi]|uniref:YopX family protein n=1 Tax=Helicobacter cinaedi TaxID=213 RepID=UPI001F174B5F|nr:YopX family protein [Helicobacter cinaedi]BDB65707.1 hypothetical protein T36_2186 [Helicobacter cinaedi]